MDDAVGGRSDVIVVGDDHHGHLLAVAQPAHEIEHPCDRTRVEAAGRLVGEQEARVVGEGTRDRDPLALAARELRRPPVLATRQIHGREQFVRTRPLLLAGCVRSEHRDLHVVERVQVGKQVVQLEHQPDFVATVRSRVAQRREVDAEHPQASLVGAVERGDELQERGLAAPRRAGDGDVLARRDRQREPVERVHEVAVVGLVDVDRLDGERAVFTHGVWPPVARGAPRAAAGYSAPRNATAAAVNRCAREHSRAVGGLQDALQVGQPGEDAHEDIGDAEADRRASEADRERLAEHQAR